MMKHGISVICWIYNEEERIRRFIESFYHYDEIIIVDKSSTDRSVEIAKEMGVKVVTIPYTEEFKKVFDAGMEAATQDWIFFNTASDIIHPELTKKLYDKIEDEDFNFKFNNIKYPCVHHVLGISGKNTMFDWGHRNCLGRKDAMVGQSQIHKEIYYENSRTYTFKRDDIVALHHMGYVSLEQAYERSLRYSKEELKKAPTLGGVFKHLCCYAYAAMVRNRVWKKGWVGMASLFWMLSYEMMIFLRLIEKEMGNIGETYNELSRRYCSENEEFRNKEYMEYYRRLKIEKKESVRSS